MGLQRVVRVLSGPLVAVALACAAPVEESEDTDVEASTQGRGDPTIEVRFVDHLRSCGERCGTWRSESVLTLELRSTEERTLQVQWVGSNAEGRPEWSTWGRAVTDVELRAGAWTDVVVHERPEMCATTVDLELPAAFELEIDGEPFDVEGTHVETAVGVECD